MLVGMPEPSLARANNASASKTSLSTQLSTYLRLRVAIQVRTAINGHVSSSVENSFGLNYRTCHLRAMQVVGIVKGVVEVGS